MLLGGTAIARVLPRMGCCGSLLSLGTVPTHHCGPFPWKSLLCIWTWTEPSVPGAPLTCPGSAWLCPLYLLLLPRSVGSPAGSCLCPPSTFLAPRMQIPPTVLQPGPRLLSHRLPYSALTLLRWVGSPRETEVLLFLCSQHRPAVGLGTCLLSD